MYFTLSSSILRLLVKASAGGWEAGREVYITKPATDTLARRIYFTAQACEKCGGRGGCDSTSRPVKRKFVVDYEATGLEVS